MLDSEQTLTDCLEFDWSYSRITNFVRSSEDQAKLKNVVKKHYESLKGAYKILSAYSGNDIFSIGSNILTEFLNQCGIFDNLYGPSDFGVNLNSTLVQKEKGQIYNPGNSLVRYEFLEILIRIAMDRFIRNKISTNYADAFEKLMEDHVTPVISTYNTQKWRNSEYLCEEVDLVLKANKELFLCLFKKYSGRYTLPGKKPFMSLEEFRQLCNEGNLIGDNLAAREIDVYFSQAMMTQVNELYYKRHMEMSFVEMLEALCRALDVSETFNNDKFQPNSSISTKLSKKIEMAVPWLVKLCPVAFQDEYVIPGPDVYTKMMYKVIPGG